MLHADVDVDESLQAFADAAREFTRNLHVAVDESAKDGAVEARTTKRYKDRSGDLTSSILGNATSTNYVGAEGILEAETQYASYVNDGTAAHEIVGRPLLRFQTADGQWVTARRVIHPGTQPDGFMDRGSAKAEQALTERAMHAIDQFADRLER